MVPERALGAAQSGPLPGSLQTGTVLPMLNPPLPQHPILKLHWPGETSPLHPVYPRDPNPPNALVATGDPLPGSQTHPAPSLGRIFMVKQQPSPALPAWACTTWGETFDGRPLVPAYTTVSFRQIAEICGSKANAAAFTVNCDFRGRLQAQHRQQSTLV